jgi:hypothetical protein
MLGLVFLVFAFVLAICAAAAWPPISRPHLGWAAFAFFLAYLIFGNAIPLLR